MSQVEAAEDESYAMGVANGSYEWYRAAAIRSRRAYRISETATVVISALIPASTALAPGYTVAPAILGSLVVVLTGLRAVFHWHENYLRFSGAREAVEAERRLYRTGAPPYDDADAREQILAAEVTRIEQEEMRGWVKIAIQRPKA